MNNIHTWFMVAIIALVTSLLRFLPFIVLGGNKKTPPLVKKLSTTLPYAVMGMLVVYCLKGVTLTTLSGFIPSLIACLVVCLLYIWKRNTLLSIIAGTICYMVLVQLVF